MPKIVKPSKTSLAGVQIESGVYRQIRKIAKALDVTPGQIIQLALVEFMESRGVENTGETRKILEISKYQAGLVIQATQPYVQPGTTPDARYSTD